MRLKRDRPRRDSLDRREFQPGQTGVVSELERVEHLVTLDEPVEDPLPQLAELTVSGVPDQSGVGDPQRESVVGPFQELLGG